MENQHSENDLKEIAAQLRCPQGEKGLKTVAMMNISNKGMTESAISALSLSANENVLEIGPGNANHLEYLIQQAESLTYTGADISPLMIEEASKINASFINNNQANFILTAPDKLSFAPNEFNKIFTVNTLYFWQNPQQFLNEVYRILSLEGTFVLCFANKTFMETLPFTSYAFKLYDVDSVEELLRNSGFNIERTQNLSEEIYDNRGQLITRKYYVITTFKAR